MMQHQANRCFIKYSPNPSQGGEIVTVMFWNWNFKEWSHWACRSSFQYLILIDYSNEKSKWSNLNHFLIKMKTSLKLEELAMLLLGIYLFSQLHLSWWWFIGLFFAPDIGMLGYLVNPKVGAWCYNMFHLKSLGV